MTNIWADNKDDRKPEPIALNQTDAALALGVSVPTLRRWTVAGIVPVKRVGKVTLYSVEALKAFVRPKSESGEDHGIHRE